MLYIYINIKFLGLENSGENVQLYSSYNRVCVLNENERITVIG